MIKPTVHLERFVGKEMQGGQDPLLGHLAADPAMIGGNAVSRQAEAGRSDAGHSLVVRPVFRLAAGTGAIEHQAGTRIGVLHEITERAAGDVVHQIAVGAIESSRGGIGSSKSHRATEQDKPAESKLVQV